MFYTEAINEWSRTQAEGVLEQYNSFKRKRALDYGEEFHESYLIPESIHLEFEISPEVPCPDGHSASECFQSIPSRPIISVKCFDNFGQKLSAMIPLETGSLNELVQEFILIGGGAISSPTTDNA